MGLLSVFPGVRRTHVAPTTITAPAPERVRGQGSVLTREIHMPVWTRVALYVLLFGTLQLMLVQLALIAIPMLWGWQWHNVGCDNKSWSMCAPGGVMPLSQYWIAKAEQYKPGDIISFNYRGSADVSENGPSVKLVDATVQGWVHVHGMNFANSIPPCWVPLADVNGKIVWGPYSLLPESFWRWATMGWTLEYNDIHARIQNLTLPRLFVLMFYPEGRMRIRLLREYPASRVLSYSAEAYVVKQSDTVIRMVTPTLDREFGCLSVGVLVPKIGAGKLVYYRERGEYLQRVTVDTVSLEETIDKQVPKGTELIALM